MNSLQDFNINRWLRSTSGQIFLIFLVITAFYLITEHTAHVFGALPYILLLLCPLLHVFMHGGHGNHTGSQNQRDSESDHPQGHVH